MLGDKNSSLSAIESEIWIAKKDRTILAKINGNSGIGFSKLGKKNKLITHTSLYRLNNINEMEFSVPFEVEINHAIVRNPAVDLIKDKYNLKVVRNGIEEWYLITNITSTMDDTKDIKIVKAKSLGIELGNRNISNWNILNNNLSSLMNGGTTLDQNGISQAFSGLLNGTGWMLDSQYDVTFDTMFRSISLSKTSILDAINKVAQTFNSIVLWDTVNRKINFQQLINVGQNKGGRISYKNYMRSCQNESNTDAFYTRFKPIGKAGLDISGYNINGMPFLDDFSQYMYPFYRDSNKNVITSSDYMSDSLCNSLMDYSQLLQSNSGNFTTLQTSLTTYQKQLTTKNNDMIALVTTQKSINAQLTIAQTTNQPTATLQSQLTAQNTLIATKQSEINAVNANITSTNASISALHTTLSTANNFTQNQLSELIPYIEEYEWTDSNISDAKSLYDAAVLQFAKYKSPQTIIKIDMINLFESIDEQLNWDKFGLGDTILVEYDIIGTSVLAKIIELSFDHQNGNITATLANCDDLIRDKESVMKLIYQGVSAANTQSINLDDWNGISEVTKNVNAIYTQGIDAAKIALTAGVNDSVVINENGITITDSANSLHFIRMSNGTIGLSINGGNTFGVCMDGSGIFANKLVGQMILGTNLTITDNTNTFNIVGNLLTIKDASNITRVYLGEYATDKYGLKLMNKTGTATIIDQDGIMQTDTVQLADNVDSSHPLKIKFYVDDSVIRVDKVKLNFSVEQFRAYSTGAASGGAASVTSSSGGGAFVSSSSGGGAYVSSSNGGGATNYFGSAGGVNYGNVLQSYQNFTQSAGGHNHGIGSGVALAESPSGAVTWVWASDHLHGMYDFYLTTPNHSHTVQTPDHTHTVSTPNHTHDVYVPNHTHAIQYGIYESGYAAGITIYVDGVLRDNTGYNSDSNVDLTAWVTTAGWHTVEVHSNSIGRINAGIYTRTFVGL